MKCVMIMKKENSFPSGTFDTAWSRFARPEGGKGKGKKKKEDRKLEKEEGGRGNPGLSENSMVLISLRI